MTLRQRLFLWYGCVLLMVAGLLVVAVYLVVAHKLNGDFRRFLTDEYLEAVSITSQYLDDLDRLQQAVMAEMKGARYYPTVYRLYDLDASRNLVTFSQEEKWLESLPPVQTADDEPVYSAILHGHKGQKRENRDEMRFLTGWVDRERLPNLVLQVGLRYNRVDKRLSSLRDNLAMVFLVTAVLALAGGHLAASRGLKPLHEITGSLEQIRARNLSYRLPESETHDEIGRIVRSANSMLDRIESAFLHLRDFTADAAHELRTPLTAAKCRLDVALERQRDAGQYQQAIRDALDRLSGLGTLVDNLLLLAELDAEPGRHERRDVHLYELFADIADFFGIVAEQNEINLSVVCADQCVVSGNATLLRRLFSNLIENAIRHTPLGGEVRLETSCTDSECEVTVTDSGPGLPPGELANVFRRFYRADSARTWGKEGAGLGLSICQKIVETHGGRISATSQQGKGTSVHVWLPR